MASRLKSLELNGYKTFASRTLFEFADTITVIVGPNGSGKSNIADSMRWVLGEQSYRLLRGKRTEDMIFSGSESRPRAGMASATITFNNEDGWLPIDFSEVGVTRRAYRDGQNEYLINGQRVRLKDVSELLAESGLAERTYTIIGQGLVDAALSLRADERRRLFEEAAGIGLHRMRREEALQRLDITQRNLERILDILSEIRPRLAGLERQAKKTSEYLQVMSDLKVLLRDYYGFHWHRSQVELARFHERCKADELELKTARTKQDLFDQQISELQSKIIETRSELNSWLIDLKIFNDKREINQQKASILSERIRSQKEQQQIYAFELNEIIRRLDLQKNSIAETEEEFTKVTHEIIEIQNLSESTIGTFEKLKTDIVQLNVVIQSLKEKIFESENKKSQFLNLINDRRILLNNTITELKTHELEKSKTENETVQLSLEREQAQSRINELQKLLEIIENEGKLFINDLSKSEEEQNKHQEKKAEVVRDIARISAEIDVLEIAGSALSGYSEGTKVLLREARTGKLPGMKDALINFLDIPDEYESAITSALGLFFESVVFDDYSEAALDLLMAKETKGVILPLKEIKNEFTEISTVEFGDEIIGIASDLITAPKEIEPAIKLLLGDFVIVRDRNAAKKFSLLSQKRTHAVSLTGEVFLSNGAVISAGNDTKRRKSTLLNQTKKRELFNKKLQELKKNENDLAEKLDQIKDHILKVKVKIRESEREKFETRSTINEISRNIGRLQIEYESRVSQEKWRVERIHTLKNEITEFSASIKNLENEIIILDEIIEKDRKILEEKNNLLPHPKFDEKQAEVLSWNTKLAVIERAKLDLATLLAEKKNVYNESLSIKSNVEQKNEESSKSLQQLEIELHSELRNAEEILHEIGQLELKVTPAQQTLQILEQELANLQPQEISILKQLRTAEQVYTQAQIELARQHEAVQGLRNRIEDDFGLVEFDYIDQISGPTPLPFEGLVEQLPEVEMIPPDLEETIKQLRNQLRRMGPVNPEAQVEYREVKQRNEFLSQQVEDLQKAEVDLRQVLQELDVRMETEFCNTFEKVEVEFSVIFNRLFGGGSAHLILSDPSEISTTGIEIDARLPGRRIQGLSLLSGGERSLTATALIFALLKVSPTPFCLLDEVDAMLDESNTFRFRELLREMSNNTQFVVVTHNRNTVEAADVIYGVTMGKDSSSKVLSLNLDEISKVLT